MPRLLVNPKDLWRRRLDARALKSPCCQAAMQLTYETFTTNRHAMVAMCLKCDDLWVYYEAPDESSANVAL
jgi:hypothetical protein